MNEALRLCLGLRPTSTPRDVYQYPRPTEKKKILRVRNAAPSQRAFSTSAELSRKFWSSHGSTTAAADGHFNGLNIPQPVRRGPHKHVKRIHQSSVNRHDNSVKKKTVITSTTVKYVSEKLPMAYEAAIWPFGSLVWGKYGSERWWPSFVVDPADAGLPPPPQGQLWLFWLGCNQLSLVRLERITQLDCELEKRLPADVTVRFMFQDAIVCLHKILEEGDVTVSPDEWRTDEEYLAAVDWCRRNITANCYVRNAGARYPASVVTALKKSREINAGAAQEVSSKWTKVKAEPKVNQPVRLKPSPPRTRTPSSSTYEESAGSNQTTPDSRTAAPTRLPSPPPLQGSFPRRHIRVLSLFDGISAGLMALREIGLHPQVYFASEIDPQAILVSDVKSDGAVIQLGDVRSLDESALRALMPIDLLIGGSPCNELSVVNPARKGLLGGTGLLFFEFCRIRSQLQILNGDRHLFWLFENVASMPVEIRETMDRFLGCEGALWDAAQFSPQRRLRQFWGNLPALYSGGGELQCSEKSRHLSSVLTAGCGRQAALSRVGCVTTKTNSLKGNTPDTRFPVRYNDFEDTLWVCELERLFGFPEHYTDVGNLSSAERQRLLGRSWSVPCVAHLFRPLTDYYLVAK